MITGARLTDAHIEELESEGFVIVRDFLPGDMVPELVAAMHRVLKPWDEVKDNPPAARADFAPWPSAEPSLGRMIVYPEAVRFARRWLGTEHIHYRSGLFLVRYPGFRDDATAAHQ